jgi:hypothetical protein
MTAAERKAWDDRDFIFRRAYYTQLDVGAFFYWTMGWPLNWPDGTPCKRIINRKPLTMKTAPAQPLVG